MKTKTTRPIRRSRLPPTITEALEDERLFGGHPCFEDLFSWRPWLVFLKACYGLDLDDSELKTFRTHTGRTRYDPPSGGWREVVCIVGRQAGKSRIAALLATFEAVLARPEKDRTLTYALCVSQDQRSSQRVLLEYMTSFVQASPLVEREVVKKRAESVELLNGVVYASEFRAGIASFLDPEVIEAIVIPGRVELAPRGGVHYRAFADPSGGLLASLGAFTSETSRERPTPGERHCFVRCGNQSGGTFSLSGLGRSGTTRKRP